MTNSRTITLDLDDYIDLLKERRLHIEKWNWYIPEYVWDFFIEILEECGLSGNTAPSYIVDNIAINGDYGDFDEYKVENETDAEFIDRVQDTALFIDPTLKVVIFSLGV